MYMNNNTEEKINAEVGIQRVFYLVLELVLKQGLM